MRVMLTSCGLETKQIEEAFLGLLTTMKDGSKNWSRIIQEYQMKKKCLPGHSFWFGTRTGRLSA